jgi:hypothetical protein
MLTQSAGASSLPGDETNNTTARIGSRVSARTYWVTLLVKAYQGETNPRSNHHAAGAFPAQVARGRMVLWFNDRSALWVRVFSKR